MPLSDRLKGLLDWWQLRIRTNQKDNEVNDARINIDAAVSPSVCVGDSNKERQ
jgi:hypothetical protein